MKKLTSWLKWIDQNLLHIILVLFILAAPLVPKLPITYVEYTYIRIRYDDFIIAFVYLVFAIQFIRKKVQFNPKFIKLFLIFWAAVFLSFLFSFYIQKTVPVFNIGLLHSLRRLQYMGIFFVASSLAITEKSFRRYLKLYFLTVLIVVLYGIGQKFLGFPSIQSINPAYADGRLLILNPEDRINSTFGGHFDLAAYLTFSIPLLLGFYISKLGFSFYYYLIFIVSLIALLYTTARSSFIAYVASTFSFLIYSRRFKLLIMTLLITAGLTFFTGEMTKRFLQTFQFRIVFTNFKTGEEKIDQTITTKELPAGSYQIPIAKKKKATVSEEELARIALEQAHNEARKKGKDLNAIDAQKRAEELINFIKPQQTLLCDISCATRLQLEWPRAIAAFFYNPILGSGPSSITEATDNDFLRWLGELGLLGTIAFLFLLYSISRFIWKNAKNIKEWNPVFKGFVFGTAALLINALYVDVFEASKVAYNYWLMAGIFIGFIMTHQNAKKASK